MYGNNRISDTTLDGILKDLKTTISFLNIANRYNITSQTVLNYMDKYICPKRRILSEVICIDEFKNLSHGKGKYACVLLNYQNGEVLDVLPNRRLAYLQYYFNHISINERKKVKYENAETFLITFINSLNNSLLPEFIEVAKTFKNWLPYIINSFNKDEYGQRMSNGIIEGSNNKIKVLKRVSYGYSDFYHLRNRIMYIFNDNEIPLPIPLDLKQINSVKKAYYKPRKKYEKRSISL